MNTHAPNPAPTSTKAIVAFVLGIITVFSVWFVCGYLSGLIGALMAWMALQDVQSGAASQKSKSIAMFGLVLNIGPMILHGGALIIVAIVAGTSPDVTPDAVINALDEASEASPPEPSSVKTTVKGLELGAEWNPEAWNCKLLPNPADGETVCELPWKEVAGRKVEVSAATMNSGKLDIVLLTDKETEVDMGGSFIDWSRMLREKYGRPDDTDTKLMGKGKGNTAKWKHGNDLIILKSTPKPETDNFGLGNDVQVMYLSQHGVEKAAKLGAETKAKNLGEL